MGPHPRLNGLRMLLIYQGTVKCRLMKIWVRLSVVCHGFGLGGRQQETQRSRRHKILAFPNKGLSGCNSQVYCLDNRSLILWSYSGRFISIINHLDLLTKVFLEYLYSDDDLYGSTWGAVRACTPVMQLVWLVANLTSVTNQ